MTPLPEGFCARPFAHRGLHDRAAGRVENSRAAVAAAVAAGYGVEIDVQLAACGEAMVFHDATLERLTGETGAVAARSAAELGAIVLKDGGETIPTLGEILALIPADTPLLVELKDPSGRLDATGCGPLEARVAALLDGAAPCHVPMSFNPFMVAEMARLLPARARGLVARERYAASVVNPDALSAMTQAEAIGAAFVTLSAGLVTSPRARALRDAGLKVMCWTISSAEAATAIAADVDAITFEGFLP